VTPGVIDLAATMPVVWPAIMAPVVAIVSIPPVVAIISDPGIVRPVVSIRIVARIAIGLTGITAPVVIPEANRKADYH
jgi:hypothetical protein